MYCKRGVEIHSLNYQLARYSENVCPCYAWDSEERFNMAETSKHASRSRLAWCGRLILYSTPVATCLLFAVSLYNLYEVSQHERKLIHLEQHVFHHHRRDFRDRHDAAEPVQPEEIIRRHARALGSEESSASLFEEYFIWLAELQVDFLSY